MHDGCICDFYACQCPYVVMHAFCLFDVVVCVIMMLVCYDADMLVEIE